MTAFFKKLKSKVGESLIESLCAILIFTMASVVLFSMVSAAADINGKAKIKDEENQANLIAVEMGDPAAYNGSAVVTFRMKDNNAKVADVNVDIYGGRGGSLYTYFVQLQQPSGSGG